MSSNSVRRLVAGCVGAACLAGGLGVARGQSSSLFARPQDVADGPGLTIAQATWCPSGVQLPKTVQEHDIISIRVQEGSEFLAEGESDNRKTINYGATLLDWVTLSGLRRLEPNAQADGDPKVAGTVNSRYRAQGAVETRESLVFNVAAEVVGIRPNGNLVLEARRTIDNNGERWEVTLSGECRSADVQAGNTVLSRDIANLQISKRELGSVRDNYRRGWFTSLFDHAQPF